MPGAGPLSRLLAREAPAAREAVVRALLASRADDLERSVLGAAAHPKSFAAGASERVGTQTNVGVPQSAIDRALRATPRGESFLDYHSHPVGVSGEGISPSAMDLAFWSSGYPDVGRDYQFLIAQPPSRREFEGFAPANYMWFKTQRPQLLSPKRAEDARYELQRALSRGQFNDVLSPFEDYGFGGGDWADQFEPWSRFWLQRYDESQGRGLHQLRDTSTITGPGEYSQDVIDALTPRALDVLRAKRFARGGRVPQRGALCACGGHV